MFSWFSIVPQMNFHVSPSSSSISLHLIDVIFRGAFVVIAFLVRVLAYCNAVFRFVITI